MTSFALEAAAWEIACWSSLYVRTSVGAAVGLGVGRLVGAGEVVGAGVGAGVVGLGVGSLVGGGEAVGAGVGAGVVGLGVGSSVGADDWGAWAGFREGAGVAVGTNVAVGDGDGQPLPAARVPSSSTHTTESYGALPLTVPPNDQLISLGQEPLVKLSV